MCAVEVVVEGAEADNDRYICRCLERDDFFCFYRRYAETIVRMSPSIKVFYLQTCALIIAESMSSAHTATLRQ